MRVQRAEKLVIRILFLLCTALALELYSKVESSEDGKVVYQEKTITEESALPTVFDLRKEGKVSAVRDQGTGKNCWAEAASGALESVLLPEEEHFSAEHMTLQNAFSREKEEGGDYTMVMAYLAGWQGPVKEADMSEEQNQVSPEKHVQEIQLLPEKDYEAIKKAVYQYGAVQSAVYMDMQSAFSSSVYYNQLNFSYCYPMEAEENHDILIVGWDDTYPAENFNFQTKSDGAFLCQNSWGNEFGENGFFYISYEDVCIGRKSIVYTKVEDADNYSAMYQTDLCGWVGQLGYGDDLCYFANIFQAETEEVLEAVGFYATGEDTQYSIMVMDGEKDLSNALLEDVRAAGQLDHAGYYTVKLQKPKEMKPGKKYAVIIKIRTPGSAYPVAAEYAADEATQTVQLQDGDGYISHNGAKWIGTESEYGCNVCMKIYTEKQEDANR